MIGVFWLQPIVFLFALVELGLVSSSLPVSKPATGKKRR